MENNLSVNVCIYAGGHIVAGAALHTLFVAQGAMNTLVVPSRFSSYRTYNLELNCLGPAGPEGWLALNASLTDENRQPLGQMSTPGLLWTRPWPVPMVVHLPQVNPTVPVHTLTLNLLGGPYQPVSVAPPED